MSLKDDSGLKEPGEAPKPQRTNNKVKYILKCPVIIQSTDSEM